MILCLKDIVFYPKLVSAFILVLKIVLCLNYRIDLLSRLSIFEVLFYTNLKTFFTTLKRSNLLKFLFISETYENDRPRQNATKLFYRLTLLRNKLDRLLLAIIFSRA